MPSPPGAYCGALIAESLRPAAVLDGFPLTVTKIYRAELGDAEAGQPGLWTVIEFEVPADVRISVPGHTEREVSAPTAAASPICWCPVSHRGHAIPSCPLCTVFAAAFREFPMILLRARAFLAGGGRCGSA